MGAPEKIWYQSLNSRNRYLANLRDRGKGGGGDKGATPNPSAWFDKKKPLALRVVGGRSHCTV